MTIPLIPPHPSHPPQEILLKRVVDALNAPAADVHFGGVVNADVHWVHTAPATNLLMEVITAAQWHIEKVGEAAPEYTDVQETIKHNRDAFEGFTTEQLRFAEEVARKAVEKFSAEEVASEAEDEEFPAVDAGQG